MRRLGGNENQCSQELGKEKSWSKAGRRRRRLCRYRGSQELQAACAGGVSTE